ncbi:hypothetical protein [uncultured Campylobacter sp.]|nr:hypothetical protein [uncultured Campylobacter sp.]
MLTQIESSAPHIKKGFGILNSKACRKILKFKSKLAMMVKF